MLRCIMQGMRALHEADIVSVPCKTHNVFVNAVSGGAIAALVWDAYVRSTIPDELWPERMLLELVTSVPRFGGLFNWKMRRHGAWEQFLTDWWSKNTRSIRLSRSGNFVTMAR